MDSGVVAKVEIASPNVWCDRDLVMRRKKGGWKDQRLWSRAPGDHQIWVRTKAMRMLTCPFFLSYTYDHTDDATTHDGVQFQFSYRRCAHLDRRLCMAGKPRRRRHHQTELFSTYSQYRRPGPKNPMC